MDGLFRVFHEMGWFSIDYAKRVTSEILSLIDIFWFCLCVCPVGSSSVESKFLVVMMIFTSAVAHINYEYKTNLPVVDNSYKKMSPISYFSVIFE